MVNFVRAENAIILADTKNVFDPSGSSSNDDGTQEGNDRHGKPLLFEGPGAAKNAKSSKEPGTPLEKPGIHEPEQRSGGFELRTLILTGKVRHSGKRMGQNE